MQFLLILWDPSHSSFVFFWTFAFLPVQFLIQFSSLRKVRLSVLERERATGTLVEVAAGIEFLVGLVLLLTLACSALLGSGPTVAEVDNGERRGDRKDLDRDGVNRSPSSL